MHKSKNCGAQCCKGKDPIPGQTASEVAVFREGESLHFWDQKFGTKAEQEPKLGVCGWGGTKETWASVSLPFPGSQDKLQQQKVRFTGGSTADSNIWHTSSHLCSDKCTHPPELRRSLCSLISSWFLVGQLCSLPLALLPVLASLSSSTLSLFTILLSLAVQKKFSVLLAGY